MSIIDDQMNMLRAKRTVSDFFSDICTYNYNCEYTDLSYSRAKKNYEKLLKRLAGLNLPDPKQFKFQQMSLEELTNTIKELLNKILGDKYQTEIESMIKLIKPIKIDDYFDSIIEETPSGENLTPEHIYISKKLYCIQVVSTAHEFLHGLMSKYKGRDFNQHFSNVHYNELLPILIEYIICYELSTLLKDKKIIESHETIRISHDKAQATELLSVRSLSSSIYKSNNSDTEFYKAYMAYQEHNAFKYISNDIFSIHLLNYYFDDPSTLLKIIKSILDGEKTLQDLINYYDISFRNADTLTLYNAQIDRTLKYQIK